MTKSEFLFLSTLRPTAKAGVQKQPIQSNDDLAFLKFHKLFLFRNHANASLENKTKSALFPLVVSFENRPSRVSSDPVLITTHRVLFEWRSGSSRVLLPSCDQAGARLNQACERLEQLPGGPGVHMVPGIHRCDARPGCHGDGVRLIWAAGGGLLIAGLYFSSC